MKIFKEYSANEIESTLLAARRHNGEGRHLFGPNVSKLVDEFIDLNIDHSHEIWILLGELLEEVSAKDCVGTDSFLNGKELPTNCIALGFTWNSRKLNKTLHLKFLIKNETFYYLSLHAVNEGK